MFLEGAATFVTTDVVAAGAAAGAGTGVVADVWHYLSTLNTWSPLTWIRFNPYPCIFSFLKIRIVQLFPSLPGFVSNYSKTILTVDMINVLNRVLNF